MDLCYALGEIARTEKFFGMCTTAERATESGTFHGVASAEGLKV